MANVATIRCETKARIGTITLDRPDALNGFTDAMCEQLMAATAALAADRSVRCLVLRGAGKAFMGGGDLKAMQASIAADRHAHEAGFERSILRAHALIDALRDIDKPVVAAVHGAVAGFGIGLCFAADLIVAREDAMLVPAWRHVALPPDGGASYFLPRLVGEKRAKEMLMLGERMPAARAEQLGLFNRVVPAAMFEAEVLAVARCLADGPTRALGTTKRLIHDGASSTWADQSRRETAAVARAVASEDHREGLQAFLSKRAPVFGRRDKEDEGGE